MCVVRTLYQIRLKYPLYSLVSRCADFVCVVAVSTAESYKQIHFPLKHIGRVGCLQFTSGNCSRNSAHNHVQK